MAKLGEPGRKPASNAKQARDGVAQIRAIIENIIDGIVTIYDGCVIESFSGAAAPSVVPTRLICHASSTPMLGR